MTDSGTTLVQAVLTEHRHKSPRVQARLVLEALGQQRVEPAELPPTVLHDKYQPDPEAWPDFQKRLAEDPFDALVEHGYATTRSRTHNAFRSLGLDPTEVRAVVIEHDWLRVYRYDAPGQANVPQTVPILEEPA